MTLYSFKGAYPTQLPNRIKLSNGFTKTDKSTFMEEEILDAGWIKVDNPPIVTYPNKLEWSGSSYTWIVREPNVSETAFKWQEIQNECKRRLDETDYKINKAIETAYMNGTNVNDELDTNWINYRQELRDIYNNVNDINPWNIIYPVLMDGSEEETGT